MILEERRLGMGIKEMVNKANLPATLEAEEMRDESLICCP